jgi:hypothetical protein
MLSAPILREGILGMLPERALTVGHIHFGILQLGVPGAPFSPAAQCENGNTNQCYKCRGPERKTCLVNVAGRAVVVESPPKGRSHEIVEPSDRSRSCTDP